MSHNELVMRHSTAPRHSHSLATSEVLSDGIRGLSRLLDALYGRSPAFLPMHDTGDCGSVAADPSRSAP